MPRYAILDIMMGIYRTKHAVGCNRTTKFPISSPVITVGAAVGGMVALR